MQFSPFFLLGVNFLIFDTEQSGVLSLSRESSIRTRAQSFDWIHPFLSPCSRLSKDLFRSGIYIYIFLGFFFASSLPTPTLWIMTHGWQMLKWKPDFIPLRIRNPIFSVPNSRLELVMKYELKSDLLLLSENEMACYSAWTQIPVM